MRVKWSQNFLIDKNIARKSVDALSLTSNDNVLEIGPGKGILTAELLKVAKTVAAVEIDPTLSIYLTNHLKDFHQFNLIQKDFLDFSVEDLKVFHGESFKVIGNLPYAIVSAAIQQILALPQWSTAVLMVQKEVADRILAQKGVKEYGILSIAVQSQSVVRKLCSVSRFCFRPQPNVESTCLQFFPLETPVWDKKDEKKFFTVVRAAFAQRRKTILNSLKAKLDIPIPKIKEALATCSIPESARAETLAIKDFVCLSEKIL